MMFLDHIAPGFQRQGAANVADVPAMDPAKRGVAAIKSGDGTQQSPGAIRSPLPKKARMEPEEEQPPTPYTEVDSPSQAASPPMPGKNLTPLFDAAEGEVQTPLSKKSSHPSVHKIMEPW